MNCEKIKFKTEIEAEIAINHIKEVKRKYKRAKRPIRYYLCEYCNHYHLTSKDAIPEIINLVYESKFKILLQENHSI